MDFFDWPLMCTSSAGCTQKGQLAVQLRKTACLLLLSEKDRNTAGGGEAEAPVFIILRAMYHSNIQMSGHLS